MYTGPHIIKDGLVFGYDTGYGIADNDTATRFYTGAPTINYIHGQNAVAQDSYTTYSATSSGTWDAKHPNAIRAYNAQGGDITGYVNTGVTDWTNTYHAVWELDPILKKPVVVMNDVSGQWKAKSYGTGLGTWTSQGKGHGDTYTISWLQWVDNLSKNAKAGLYTKNTSGGNGFHDGQANSASSYNTETHTWQRVYQTYTTSSVRDLNNSQASVYMYGQYNVRGTVKIADVQFTWGSIAVPFSEVYERSSTASLIDLKETASIDLSNVSFDSTGQPTFDGSNDKIVVPNQISTGSYTYETVVKISSSDSSYSGFGSNFKSDSSGYSGVGNGWVIRLDPDGGLQVYTKNNSTTLLNPINISGFRAANVNKYIHLVYTYSNGSNKLYLNGILQATGTGLSGTTPSDSTLIIGAYSWGISSQTYYINAHQPIAKLYNQTHTATEIKQNFNAYKNRFSI